MVASGALPIAVAAGIATDAIGRKDVGRGGHARENLMCFGLRLRLSAVTARGVGMKRLKRISFFLATALVVGAPALAQEQTTRQLPVPAGASAAVQSTDSRWMVKFDSEIKYSLTDIIGRSSLTGGTVHGNVLQLPFGMAIVGRPNDLWKLELGLRGGYIDSRQRNETFDSRFSGFTDTTVSATTTYFGFDGFQPYVSINANLPTGTSLLTTTKINAVPDPDVTQTKGFGEGTNIGPTVGVNIPINANTILALGVGHTIRGQFTRAGDFGNPTSVLNPGDVTTATAQIGYRSGPLSLMAQFGYSWETMTTLDGVAFFRAGDRIQVAVAAGYAWTEMWSSRVTVSYSHFNKNVAHNPPPFGAIGIEPFNSNNDVVNVVFDTTYRNGAYAVGPSIGYMYRARNGWDPTAELFVPAKNLWTFGGVGRYQVTNSGSLTARVQYLTGKTSEILNIANPAPELTTRGWQFSLGGTVQL